MLQIGHFWDHSSASIPNPERTNKKTFALVPLCSRDHILLLHVNAKLHRGIYELHGYFMRCFTQNDLYHNFQAIWFRKGICEQEH